MKKYIYELFNPHSREASFIKTTIKMPEMKIMVKEYQTFSIKKYDSYDVESMIKWFKKKGYEVKSIKEDYSIDF